MRGTDNQHVCPLIMGCYTHWTFWGLFHASGSALFPAFYVVCYVLLMHMGCCVSVMIPPRYLHLSIRFYFFNCVCPQDSPPAVTDWNS